MKRKNRLRLIVAAILIVVLAMPATLAETYSALVVCVDGMKLYADAGMETAVAELDADAVVRVKSTSGSVATLSYKGKTVYADASALTALSALCDTVRTTKDTYAYQKASTASTRVKVKAGTEMYKLATSGSWVKVEKGGYVAYINASALESTEETRTTVEAVVTAKTLTVYKSASTNSKVLGTLKKGAAVNALSWTDKWAYIELNGNYGYCAISGIARADAVSTADAKGATVSYESVAVYKSASTSSEKLGTLKYGATVNVYSDDGEWSYIEKSGHYGYCKSIALTLDEETPENATAATVKVKSLKVYTEASKSAAVLGTLKKGASVNVISWNNGWARIEKNGSYGFCLVSGLTKVVEPEPTATPSIDDAVPATVTDKSVTIYESASASSEKLGTLKKGAQVNLLGSSGIWAYVERNGSYGYCVLSALTRTSAVIPDGYTRCDVEATVIAEGIKAYASASTSANSTSVSIGQSVRVYGYNDTWAFTDATDSYRYIPLKALSHKQYDTIASSGTALQTLLKALLSYGYADNQPTTEYNDAAKTAISRFQSACGLSQTGVADQTTQRILYGGYAPTSAVLSKELSNGDSGTSVGRLQTRLYVLGYLSKSSSIDSDYGSTTASAVKLFQSASGITATGTASVATLKKLYSVNAATLPSGKKAADVSSSSSSSSSSSGYLTYMPDGTASTTSSYSSSMTNAQKLEYVIYVAQNQLGKPYVYGSAGTSSFDCSGLTLYCFKQIGISLAHSAYSVGYNSSYQKISAVSSLKRGDLVFFNTVSDSDLCDHIGIYLGNNYFIHASSGGHKVVVSNINSSYYSRVFSWGRRVLG